MCLGFQSSSGPFLTTVFGCRHDRHYNKVLRLIRIKVYVIRSFWERIQAHISKYLVIIYLSHHTRSPTRFVTPSSVVGGSLIIELSLVWQVLVIEMIVCTDIPFVNIFNQLKFDLVILSHPGIQRSIL